MKKLALFTIILLIFGTISPSLVNHAYGQNDPGILLRIATHADNQIVNQLNGVYGNEIPNNIKILYQKGHFAVESLDESLSNNNIEKAKQDFLLAMNSFMQISRTIFQSSEKVVVVTVSEKSNQSISSEIDRLEKYVKSLENISKKYDIDVESDFIKIHDLIQELRAEINNVNEVHAGIKKIKVLLDSIKNDIRESASKQSNAIKDFFEKFLIQIDQKLLEAKNLGRDEVEITKADQLILEIRELLSKNQINSAKILYSELEIVLKNIGISVKIT
jgi:archaellum component FlaC